MLLEAGIVGGNSITCPGHYLGVEGEIRFGVAGWGMVENYRCDGPPQTSMRAGLSLRVAPEEWRTARLFLLWETSSKLSALLSYHLPDRHAAARQINHAASFGTRPVRRRAPLPRAAGPEGPALEPRAELGPRCRIAHVRDRLLVGSTFVSSDQTDLLIQKFGIARLLPNDFPALARARALDPHVSATDVTSRFRTFAAYTEGESERRRLSWEARLVSTGDGPWRWVGGAFFNDAGQSGSGRELTPDLTEF